MSFTLVHEIAQGFEVFKEVESQIFSRNYNGTTNEFVAGCTGVLKVTMVL